MPHDDLAEIKILRDLIGRLYAEKVQLQVNKEAFSRTALHYQHQFEFVRDALGEFIPDRVRHTVDVSE